MENVLDYTIPYWHPLAVHFPLALILAGGLAATVWCVRGTTFWRRCTLFLMSLGMGGALFAYFTGEALEEAVEGTPVVDELVSLHEDMALWTLIATGIAVVGMVGISIWLERRTTLERDPPDPLWVRIVFTALVGIAAALVAWTSHIGGTMVWGVPG